MTVPGNKVRTKVTALSRYRELVHSYHRPHEKSVPVGINGSLLVANVFNSLDFTTLSASLSDTVLRRFINGLRRYLRYIRTILPHRRYPSSTVDQQRIAGLRPESLDGFPLFI